MTTTITLNPDLFSLVLDEIIGQLNLYRTKGLIDLAHLLRQVNHSTDRRLRRITCRYLNVPSHADLERLMRAGVPNLSKHEWIRICGDQRHTSTIFEGFLKLYTRSLKLTRLVLDLRALNAQELESRTRFATCPGSVKELAILASHGQTHGRISLFLNSFLWNGEDLKLAFCGIPSYSGLVKPGGHGTLALFLDESTQLYDVRLLSRFASQFRKSCLVRLVFANPRPSPDLERFKQELMMVGSERLVLEELVPGSDGEGRRRGESPLDWFAQRVLDGSIWTLRGRPLSTVDGVGRRDLAIPGLKGRGMPLRSRQL